MNFYVNKITATLLPLVILLTLITQMIQKVDDFNSAISQKFAVLQSKANGEEVPNRWCGTGLVIVNRNIQNLSILMLLISLLSFLSKMRARFYLFAVVNFLIIVIFNVTSEFRLIDYYSFPFDIVDLGFFSRYTTLADIFLGLFWLSFLVLLVPNLYYYVSDKFQAKIS